MAAYQQQWASAASHVRKQLARQQRLAKAQLQRQLQESGSSLELDVTLEEDEEEGEEGEEGGGGKPQPARPFGWAQLVAVMQQVQQQKGGQQAQQAAAAATTTTKAGTPAPPSSLPPLPNDGTRGE
jgi:hypothetical protein